MGIHTPISQNPRPTANLAVTGVVLELAVLPPLTEIEEGILTAYNTLDSKKEILTSKVANAAGKKRQNHTLETLWSLVAGGYIAAYKKRDKWKWCDREKAQRMIDSHPALKKDYKEIQRRGGMDNQPF